MANILATISASQVVQGIIVGTVLAFLTANIIYERCGQGNDNDRQRLENHHEMRPARQWHPPAGRMRQNHARCHCGARSCVLDND
jgi:hypothetical protein